VYRRGNSGVPYGEDHSGGAEGKIEGKKGGKTWERGNRGFTERGYRQEEGLKKVMFRSQGRGRFENRGRESGWKNSRFNILVNWGWH